MRTDEEIAEDENRQRHLDGECEGAPWCWWCQQYIEDEKARLEDERKAKACADAFKPLLWAVDRLFGGKS